MDSTNKPAPGSAESSARETAGLDRSPTAASDPTTPSDRVGAVGSPPATEDVENVHTDIPGFVDHGEPAPESGARNSSVEG